MRILNRVVSFVLIVGLLALWSAGCADDNKGRMEVSGTVKLKGQPLKEGTIQFQPISGGANSTMSGGMISNGRYKVPKTAGLAAGKYKVLITAGDGSTPIDPTVPPGPTGNFVSKEQIPAEYNVDSKQEVQVKEGLNVFDYDIP